MKKVLLFLFFCVFGFGAENEVSAVDTLFLIACSGLVLLMTPALGMFYSGMVNRNNVLSTTINSIMLYALVAIQWVIVGYTLAFGDDIGLVIGNLNHIFLVGIEGESIGMISENLFVFFQMLFAVIGAAIITGSFAERMRFGVLLIFILCWSTFVYDILAHWVWGGGWLMKIGSLDFAGGGVVHIAAGVAGLVGCIMLGKRKYAKGIVPHNLPLSFIGAVFLWIGWLGFNTGSALSVNSVAVNAFLTTNFAVVGAMLSWMMIEWVKFGKPTLLGSITGIVAGLVSITPSAGFVTPFVAVLIGFLASPICFFAISYLKSKFGYDDTLDAFGLHGVGGIWGGIATGLFATSSVNGIVSKEAASEGLFYSGDFALLGVQIVAILACFVLSAITSFVILKVISFFSPLRVEEVQEVNGLDQSLHGEIAYR
ncbi:ammonium transporter [Helicobacter pullorum MIT 98-5489]|uniref:Ammonium transporter n=1 Tax=Helicobacter pullorum MIT 98-5489 TaxID=537972 RepID=C5F294_9HELI|nr:ammonium transporter [Helicobacter pullorum]EEQ64388.1 ammonium transporter [Helicobacter pullorum MIT 98-5489]KAB0575564.1 ammonium transporter [Helicobacter pullorum NCTC 12824]OCR04172.1 ammonia channel protein [Helicobacter pullorum]OCR13976.1 ammonia channel protein [Helicobacter pullorum]OCR18302.1 ammonia channel protein [Helicobacter pullorum]